MNQRDIELLSSYLDGQLKPADAERARLEARLSSEPGLRAVLEDLQSTRNLLRRLPMRKAPRNFTLTPKMVGKNPPLPRSYPAFRFVTALASLLLFFSMGLNFIVPQMASQSPAFGMGGGGAPEVFSAEAPPATEEAPQEPSIQMAPLPTATLATADSARESVTPAAEQSAADDPAASNQAEAPSSAPSSQVELPVPPPWLMVLAGIAFLSALGMVAMRQAAASRWRQK